MANEDLILSELLCARLVHDLSGPVGAVANGAELLDEGLADGAAAAGGMLGEAVTLLSASAAAAVARLRFLRLAFGSPGAPPPTSELRRVALDYFTNGATGGEAVALDWPAALDPAIGALPPPLVLNMLLLARDGLTRGGTVRIVPPPVGAAMALVAEGPQAAPGDAAKAVAASSPSGLTARGAQGYLAARLAQQAGLEIALSAQAGRVTIALEKG